MQWIHACLPRPMRRVLARSKPVLLALLIGGYGLLASYNLGLPGLHYDEAREAGLNALELLRGAPVTAFRDAALTVGNWRLPLMVQDYIGALNVYLVLPFLALTGVGVPNLRWPAVLTGMLTLILLERAVSEWWRWQTDINPDDLPTSDAARLHTTPVTWAGVASVALLAFSPSFVFWSRQGIFVTNLTQPLCLLAIWQGVRWLRIGEGRAFLMMSASAGLSLYAKLLAGWVLGPFALLGATGYLYSRRRNRLSLFKTGSARNIPPPLTLPLMAGGIAILLLALSPLLLFNMQTGGTLTQVGQNLGQSYYGVDNRAWLENLGVRLGQVVQTLRGDHFWYLGGLHANQAAPWLALTGVAVLVARPVRVGMPVVLAGSAVALSLFTISDLFITHYALLQPLLVATVGIGWATWASLAPAFMPRVVGPQLLRGIAFMAVALWLVLDLSASLRYHGALARSGGLADHSDATYHIAYYLRYNGMGAPLALDWGLDAPIRFLSDNAVRPIEIFGYASPAAPDADFEARLALFLDNPANVYLLRSPGQAIFAGRRELFFEQTVTHNRPAVLVATFSQRDGTSLFEIWRAE